MKYRSRVFRKDVPDDQEKLMARIVNRMNGYDKEKNQNNNKKAAGALMVMMSGKKGEQSDNEEAWNQIDDDNNCEAVAKQTKNYIEHDRICLFEANIDKKKGVHINDEGGRKWTMNLTLTAFTTMNMTTQTLMGPLMVLIME